jgi:hypothetical protein
MTQLQRIFLSHRIVSMLILIGVLMTTVPPDAHAAGTRANSVITTQAQALYNSTGVSNQRTAVSNTVSLTVAYKVGIGFAPATSTVSTPDGVVITSQFTIQNTGNYDDAFTLAVAGSGTTFPAAWTVKLYKGSVGAGNEITGAVAVAEDATQIVVAQITIPADPTNAITVNGTDYTFTVNVASTTGSLAGTTVINNGPFVFGQTVQIRKPVLAFTVVQTPAGTVSPGQLMTYDLTITNSGSPTVGTSDAYWVYDDTKFQPATKSATGGASAAAGTGTAHWVIPAIANGGSVTVHFQANINQFQAPGTVVIGTAGSKVTYNDGSGTPKDLIVSSTSSFTIQQVNGFEIVQVTANALQDPGMLQEYHVQIKNWGNVADGFTLAEARNAGDLDVTHTFYDAASPAGTIGTHYTGIAPGATKDVFIRLTVPTTATMGQTIIRKITAASDVSSPTAPLSVGAGSVLASLTTTVQSASVTISIVQTLKSNAGGGSVANPAVGDVIQHEVTVANNGNRAALNIISSNIGAFPAKVTIGAVDVDLTGAGSYTDVATKGITGTGGTFTGGSVAIGSQNVTVTITTIPAGGSVKYRYTITI